MSESLRDAVVDGLDYLQALQQGAVRQDDARVRLQDVRKRHTDLAIDLLAEEVPFDETVHYDLLLRRPGAGTVSLSYCPERVTPWPLRGVQRWTDALLVRVNTTVLKVEHAITMLDFIWNEAPIVERLVNECLIAEELAREPIALSDDEVQEAMDKFRSAKNLFTAESTLCWLEQNGMTHESLESLVCENALIAKVRDRTVSGDVEAYFEKHSGDFDTARVASFDVADDRQAQNLAGQIRAGQLDFFTAAERTLLEAADRDAPLRSSLVAVIERRQAAPALREQLFAAAPGALIGPVPVESGHSLIRVLGVVPARLNGRTRAVIKKILFDDWLAGRRQAARIEWCWGNASKTG